MKIGGGISRQMPIFREIFFEIWDPPKIKEFAKFGQSRDEKNF